MTFLHRDEFREQFATSPLRDVELPAAVVEDRGALVQVVPAGQMRAAADLDQPHGRCDRRTPAGR